MDYNLLKVRFFSSFFIIFSFIIFLTIGNDYLWFLFLVLYLIIIYEIYVNFNNIKNKFLLYIYIIVSFIFLQFYLFYYFKIIDFIVIMDSFGFLPTAVSPESIRQEAPSNTELVISLHSAFVG